MADTQRHYRPDLTEWVTHNMYRNFPIIDDVVPYDDTGRQLPSSFLGGLNIECYPMHGGSDDDFFFIYSVVAAGAYINIEIGYSPGFGGDAIVCGRVSGISTALRSGDTIADRTFVVEPIHEVIPDAYSELNYMSGTLIVGSCQDISGAYTYRTAPDNSKISPLCRAFPLSGISSLIVESADSTRQTLIGDIVIKAGDGVKLSMGSETINSETLPCLIIERVPSQGEEEATIRTKDQAIQAIYASLGNPIRMINGVAPDENGNIVLADDGGCLNVTGGDGYIALSNTCVTPCCGDVNTTDVDAAITQLEDARDRLVGYYESISGSINELQSRLASLIATSASQHVDTPNMTSGGGV